jgi:hypothetical protein
MALFTQPIDKLLAGFNKLQEQAKLAVDERKKGIKALEEQKATLDKELTLATNIQDMLANLKLGK